MRRLQGRKSWGFGNHGALVALVTLLPARTGATEPLPRAASLIAVSAGAQPASLLSTSSLPAMMPITSRPAEPARFEATERRAVGWAKDLPALTIENPNSRGVASIKLYADDGTVDAAALDAFKHLVGVDETHPAPMNRRAVQLLVKAATHFDASHVTVVSAYRPGRHGGPHSHGLAIDFKLAGVRASTLAAYLRSLPRVGVGIYTHPFTQFVHVDVRETSWHWIDASPPGRTWREAPLADRNRVARDASYTSESDLP